MPKIHKRVGNNLKSYLLWKKKKMVACVKLRLC